MIINKLLLILFIVKSRCSFISNFIKFISYEMFIFLLIALARSFDIQTVDPLMKEKVIQEMDEKNLPYSTEEFIRILEEITKNLDYSYRDKYFGAKGEIKPLLVDELKATNIVQNNYAFKYFNYLM